MVTCLSECINGSEHSLSSTRILIVRSAGDMDNAKVILHNDRSYATLDMSGTPNSGDVTINMAALAITNNTSIGNWDILGNPYHQVLIT